VPLHAVITAEDLEVSVAFVIPVVVSIMIVVAAAIAVAEIVVRGRRWGRRNNEHPCVDEAALAEIKFALFSAAVSGNDVKSFVFSDSGIAAHGLIAHGNTAIESAASD
jgi:hypothetical protein